MAILQQLEDGFTAALTFSAATGLTVLAISIQPPGAQGTGGVEQTTMANNSVKTFLPGKLVEITDMKETVAYSPGDLEALMALVGVNQEITWTYPGVADHGSLWGWIEKVEPSEWQMNNRPVCVLTIKASNLNATGVETPPTIVA